MDEGRIPWQRLSEDGGRQEPFSRVRIRGSCLEFKTGITNQRTPTTIGRGCVKDFTKAARLRLLKFVASIDWTTIAESVLVTLTYPDDKVERTYKQRTQDRFLFMRKIESHLGKKVCGIWRVEWEARKSGPCAGMIAPHFHLLLFGVRFVHYKTVNRMWAGVIHHEGYLRTEIKRATSAKHAGVYISKYLAKCPERASLVNAAYLNSCGRHYGYHRVSLIPRFDLVWVLEPTAEQIAALLRFANECIPWKNCQHKESFTLLGKYADKAREILAGFGLTVPWYRQ